jgi:hypothetical protein
MVADQAGAAEACLRPLRDMLPLIPWYAVQGTEYHDAKAARELEVVAHNLGCKRYGTLGQGSGVWSREFLDLSVDGVVINAAHHVSVAGGFYRATGIDREAQWSAIAGKEGKIPKADCLVRSHCHFFCHVEHASKHAVITPCWQMQTRFMRKNSVYRMLPDIGGLLIWIDGEQKQKGEDPIRIQKILYALPALRSTKL